MSFRFGKKSTKDKLADQVEPVAEKASDSAEKIRNVVLGALGAALTATKPKVDKAAERTSALAQDAYEKANVAAHDAYDRARPRMQEAYEKANVAAHDAYDRALPYLDDATKRAEEVTENLRDDYIPRARRAANAALDEARTGSGDLQTRARDIVNVSRKELEKPEKKKGRGRKLLGFIAVAGIGAVAAYYAWARSKPVTDPWAEAYWEDVSVPKDTVDEPVETPTEEEFAEEVVTDEDVQVAETPIADAEAPLEHEVDDEVDGDPSDDHLNIDGSSDEPEHHFNEAEAAEAAGLTDPEEER